MLQIIPILLKELEQEAHITRKMLRIVPNDRYDWQPHPKSMTIRQLAGHIAELPSWVTLTLHTAELDFAKGDYQPKQIDNTEDLLNYFEQCLADAQANLAATNEEVLQEDWTLRSGEVIHSVSQKHEVIRMAYNQTTHHRAQLGVFLRLLDIPIPGSYGPSADDMSF